MTLQTEILSTVTSFNGHINSFTSTLIQSCVQVVFLDGAKKSQKENAIEEDYEKKTSQSIAYCQKMI